MNRLWLDQSVRGLLFVAVVVAQSRLAFAQVPTYDIGINQSKTRDEAQNSELISMAESMRGSRLEAEELKRFKADLVEHGWPTLKSGGTETINAAGRILQASSLEFDFQNYMLRVLDQQLGVDVDPAAYARMTDKIFSAHDGVQIYGTLWSVQGTHVVVKPKIDSDQSLRFFRDFYGLKSLKEDLKSAERSVAGGEPLPDPYANLPLSMVQTYSRPDIRNSLGRMVRDDQALRSDIMKANAKKDAAKIAELQKKLEAIDSENHGEIKRIFDEVGFPTMAMVGRDGVSTAFLLVQHADQDLGLQAKALALAKPLMERRELSRQQFAMLTDRVLIGQGKPQRYGTQLKRNGDQWVMDDVEDPLRLDSRRESMGLNSSAEYIKSSNES